MATEKGGIDYTIRIREQGLDRIRKFNTEIERLKTGLRSLGNTKNSGFGTFSKNARAAAREVGRLTAARQRLSQVSRQSIFPASGAQNVRNLNAQVSSLTRSLNQAATAQRGLGNAQRTSVQQQRALNAEAAKSLATLGAATGSLE